MSLFDRIKRDPPVMLNGPARAVPERDTFDEAFKELMKPGHVWRSRDPTAEMIQLAERVLLEMLGKQDSLICNPDEIAEKAWDVADAFARAVRKRTT